MLELNQTNKSLVTVDGTDLTKENILERYDLQEAFINSWESFTKELGFNGLHFIDKEIKPHDSVNNRIDILAYDENDTSFFIFELKRDKDKNQLLQSISYAGMLHDWTISDYKELLKENDELNELFLDGNENRPEIKIVIIAEKFDPEVILAANWLRTKGIYIYAFTIKLNKLDGKLLLSFEQNFPLKDLSDSYKPRRNIISDNKKTWEDIKIKIINDFEKKAIDELIKNYVNDPSNKRIFVNNKDILYSIIFYIRNNFIKVVTTVKDKEQGRKLLETVFGNLFQIDDWRDGLTFKIEDEQTYLKFKEWLNL